MAFLKNILSISDSQAKKILLAESLIILIFGIFNSINLGEILRVLDEEAYYGLAVSLANNGTLLLTNTAPCTFWPPGYPIFLSPFVYAGMDIEGLRILNFIGLSACGWIIFLLLKTYYGNAAGVIGASIIFIYPVLFYMAGFLYPQIFFSAVFLFIIYLVFTNTATKSIRFLIAGLIYGFLMLSIPLFTLNLVIVTPLIFYWHRKFRPVFLFIVGAALILTPWSLRNYYVLGGFAFIDTSGGLNFLYANNENTTPNGGVTVDISKYKAVGKKLNLLESDRYYKKAAFNYILTHKKESAIMYVRKVLNCFNFRNKMYTKKIEPPKIAEMILLLSYVFLLAASLFRFLFRTIPLTKIEVVFYSLYFTHPFLEAVFITRIRHRIPMDFILICLAGISLYYCLIRINNKTPGDLENG